MRNCAASRNDSVPSLCLKIKDNGATTLMSWMRMVSHWWSAYHFTMSSHSPAPQECGASVLCLLENQALSKARAGTASLKSAETNSSSAEIRAKAA